MIFNTKFISVQTIVYKIINIFFKIIAIIFGYPKNPGMPIIPIISNKITDYDKSIASLPVHKTFWPPLQRPQTWLEMVFGPTPNVASIPKYFYENKEEGFYNFYMENYKNIHFLPDYLSEFIQIKFHICLDLTPLEISRQFLFVGLFIYSYFIFFRILLSWFVTINPYTFPWYCITGIADWSEEILQGVMPSILGVNITGNIFLTLLGVAADDLNNLVFTMPFLPSEGQETKVLINEQMKDVIVFHYLPMLWYRYPIPDELRNFWYKERIDILYYMQNAYKDLNIQFLPNFIINEFNL